MPKALSTSEKTVARNRPRFFMDWLLVRCSRRRFLRLPSPLGKRSVRWSVGSHLLFAIPVPKCPGGPFSPAGRAQPAPSASLGRFPRDGLALHGLARVGEGITSRQGLL